MKHPDDSDFLVAADESMSGRTGCSRWTHGDCFNDRGKGFVDLISIQESLAGQRLTDDGVFDTGRGRVSAG